jgi:hypothetical protein
VSQVYSISLFAGTVSSTGHDYTVPDGYRVVLRQLTVAKNTDALPISIVVARTSPSNCVLLQLLIAALDDPPWHEWQGRIVLNAGDVIHIGTDALCDVSLSGYQLATLD